MTGSANEGSEQRRRLLGTKLRALVSEHVGVNVESEPVEFGTGAGLVHDSAAWVIVDGPAERVLGASLAWAVRQGASSLDVVADNAGGQLARRASGFSIPIGVWFPQDRTLLPVVVEPAPVAPRAASEHLELISLIESGGARPIIERGVVTGDVRGLEVCRVVDEPTVGNFAELNDVPADLITRPEPGVMLEVGVGANDREAFQLIHGHVPTVDALAEVVSSVSSFRRAEAPQHPLNRMAPERFLRWRLEQDPSLLGFRSVRPVDPPVPRQSMKHTEPCVATAVDRTGAPVAVVFSSGVDVDLVPFVADVTLDLPSDVERVVVAAPQRDLVALTHDLAALLARPVELVGI